MPQLRSATENRTAGAPIQADVRLRLTVKEDECWPMSPETKTGHGARLDFHNGQSLVACNKWPCH
jgi:hypothetical protein